jgi:peptidoglycan/xylan/chitin deacetylase (PgdA/CDA1 family)
MTTLSPFTPLFAALSGHGPSAKLSTLIFHRVLPEPDPLQPGEVAAERFDAVCAWLARWFRVLPLDEALVRLREGRLPRRSLCITFDDGYADNHDLAMPILRRHGLTATFFVTTGVIGGGRMWNDTVIEAVRHTAAGRIDGRDLGLDELGSLPLDSPARRRSAIERLLPAIKHLEPADRADRVERLRRLCGADLRQDLMMSEAQVRGLRDGGMQIGGHTVTHPILSRLADAEARREISLGKQTLERWLGSEVPVFAYPNGRPGDDFEPRHGQMAREAGFVAALTTAWGVASRSTDAYAIPRFTPWARQRWKFGLQMARNFGLP